MKKTGAWLARYALEQIGVRYTFGIPGVHNTEIYDELNNSELIRPVLVNHECCAAYMADAISRTTSSIGCCVIVPAAGVTHAASGIAEASLDGIPMLVISGGIRTDTGHRYQLHDMDQHALIKPITKANFKVASQNDVIPTIYKAYRIAVSGEPGPVFIEIPVNVSMFSGAVDSIPTFQNQEQPPQLDLSKIKEAASLLAQARQPGMFLGWGAKGAQEASEAIADLLGAPVATTLQGLSSFPADHPLHTGMGMGAYGVPASELAFKNCDCLLAVGTRFSEIPTGSFGINPPENLIHVDINPEVFSANYPAKVAIEGDAKQVLTALREELQHLKISSNHKEHWTQAINEQKSNYQKEWAQHDSGQKVNPGLFFATLRRILDDDAIIVADDGNHTFLTAELMPIPKGGQFISPTDFNSMGYCVPATIAAKLAHPERQVVGIVGDGAFMMTGLEMITAVRERVGAIMFVFSDGELSQISQAQKIPYNRKTCTVLGNIRMQGIAEASHAQYLYMESNSDIERVIAEAIKSAEDNRIVMVDVNIDYAKSTRFTRGIVKTNLKRFRLRDKARFISRAVVRNFTG